jgi:mannose-6-phosphate isomerase-like protein (cupin superfamily)
MQSRLMFSVLTTFACACTTARAPSPPRAITAGGIAPVEWSAEERSQDIALKTAWVTDEASAHWVRARGAEKPHVHERTDMLVFVVSGHVNMHIGNQSIEAARGDVIEVPRGTPHWVENVDPSGSVAYVVFTPAFDGTDRRFLGPQP